MKNIFRNTVLTLVMLLVGITAFAAEEVQFEVNTPMIVSVGEAFRVEFALNAKPDKGSFSAPDFGEFDVLAGPATSQGSSVQFINGNMTKSVSYTITYVLLPQNKGTFTIGSASIEVDGKRYATRPPQI